MTQHAPVSEAAHAALSRLAPTSRFAELVVVVVLCIVEHNVEALLRGDAFKPFYRVISKFGTVIRRNGADR